jgi:N-acetyl-anhydromuramyl-L-alanine amidase AmpD
MKPGAHCQQQGMNRKGIGVCIVGNFDKAPPPEDIFEKSADFVSWLCRMYRIPVDNVRGHNEFASYKTCPGEKFDMVFFRERVTDYLAIWNPPGA